VNLTLALEVCHREENEIIHRDIKPTNIFMKKNKFDLVLGDFGVAIE
jgi:serine/threonine protein kinase